MRERIGFIGTGKMGLPIARNLLADGFRLQVHNRTRERAEPLLEHGAELVDTPREAAAGVDLCLTMVSDDAAVQAVTHGTHGALEGLGDEGTHVVMSTISPATSRSLAQVHEDRGAAFVAAPVFGRPEAAEGRQLWVLLSGEDAGRARSRPVLQQIGQKVYDLGDEVGAANVVKLSGNFLIAGAMEAMAEAYTFAQKQGIERTRVADILQETLFDCPIYRGYGDKIARHAYPTGGFATKHGYKDVRLTLDNARDVQAPMPLASLLHDRLLGQLAKGRDDLDWAALGLAVAEEAGTGPG